MENKSKKKKQEGAKKKDQLEMLDMESIGRKKKRKKSVLDYVRYGIMAVAAVVFVVAGYNLYSIFSEYAKGEETYENVAKNFIKDGNDEDMEVSGNIIGIDGFVRASVDFDGLQKENPDIKAWIQFEGVDISYPVLQHPTDNEYYLTRMYNHEENTAGSIFLDITNNGNFQDYNTFVYGHNMKNLSMFGHLKEYKDEGYYAGKEYFWIYTPTANYHYQIFSYHEASLDSGMFKTFQSTGEEYSQYVAKAKESSLHDTGVEITGEDRIVTLSTCTSRGHDYRFLVHGKLVGMEIKKTEAENAEITGEGAEAGQEMTEEQP